MRSRTEIEDQIDKTWGEDGQHGSRWPGMTYEEGVRAALDWALGDMDEPPMDEE